MLTVADALKNVLNLIDESASYRTVLNRLSMAITEENLEWIKEIDWKFNVDKYPRD